MSTATLGKLRKIAFYSLVGLLSAFLALIFWDILPSLFLGWPRDGFLGSIHPRIRELLPHRLHIMVMNAILWGLVLGVVLQLFRPAQRLAPILQAFSFMLVFMAVDIALGEGFAGSEPVLIPLIVIALLHPAVRGFIQVGNPEKRIIA